MEIDIDEISNLLYHLVEVTLTVKISGQHKSLFVAPSTTLGIEKDCDPKLIYRGYLKAYDPVSKSVILCLIQDGLMLENMMVLGYYIDKLRISGQPSALSPQDVQNIIEQNLSSKYTHNSKSVHDGLSQSNQDPGLVERSDRTLQWLLKNRIPARLEPSDGSIIIADSVRLKSPYKSSSDYVCPNRIVLKRIKRIVESQIE